MEKIIKFLKNKKLCDDNFLLCMETYLNFIDPKLIDFCGCYIKENKLKAIVPKIINDYTRSVVIHELGHIYDYYLNGEIVENEDRALLWEILYLKYSKNYHLLSERINKIEKNTPNSLHYKSLQKIKRS